MKKDEFLYPGDWISIIGNIYVVARFNVVGRDHVALVNIETGSPYRNPTDYCGGTPVVNFTGTEDVEHFVLVREGGLRKFSMRPESRLADETPRLSAKTKQRIAAGRKRHFNKKGGR